VSDAASARPVHQQHRQSDRIAIEKELKMRVFITGATGYIGSAVVRELLGAGHQVVGLARSDTAAAALTAAGADVHRGALDDLDSLHDGAAAADGVIHLAFNNISETTDYAASAQTDLRAVETIGAALEDSGKPFAVTSGTLLLAMLGLGRPGTEEDASDATLPRVASENAAIALAERGVRSSVVRLAPSVHGEGDKHGFVPSLIGIARDKGISAFVGDGSNRWPAVHRLDAARLFRLAAEAAPAGSRLHGAGEDGVPFREIAEAIGRQLKLPVVSITPEDAGDHFGFLSAFVALDNPTSSALTQERLGWKPEGPALILDIEQDHYFTVEQGHYSTV
jgi:nucleoside-diphosphate-sugar epimerase